ncbi:MAG: four-helix bundle copper-binding protein [Bacteroidota bacterium]|nr:four-helix bundle copper-binding protein [Bacteroidota bacterium]
MSGFKWLEKKKHFEWMQKCLQCWEACEAFITDSIKEEKYISALHTARDCAEICSMCIKFEAQRSTFFEQLCHVCANICDACAEQCEKFPDQNESLSQCAETCRICAAACRETASDSGFQQATA